MVRRRDRHNPSSAFPGYEDVAEIGSGAFATVYRAVETDTSRPVALKALKVEMLPTYVIEAFDQEIRALGVVSDHPNIVTMYRPLSTPDRRAVLVLELCQESYAQQVRRSGPLSAQQAVAVGIKIAGALETAHRAGFLHRDLKPQNILVTQFDEPALADFGVAALRASAQATEGVFGFTTLHASPEILEGRELSPATDVYGLGSTLYQLLTGRAPFAAFDGEAPASVILRILSQPVAPLRDRDVPLGLSDVLEASLAKSAADRPASAAVLAESLRRVEAECGWAPTPYVVVGDRPTAQAAHSKVPCRAPVVVSSVPPPAPSEIAPPFALREAAPAGHSEATAPPPSPGVSQSVPRPARLAAGRGDRNSLVAPVPATRKVATPRGMTREDAAAALGSASLSPAPDPTPPARDAPAPPATAHPTPEPVLLTDRQRPEPTRAAPAAQASPPPPPPPPPPPLSLPGPWALPAISVATGRRFAAPPPAPPTTLVPGAGELLPAATRPPRSRLTPPPPPPPATRPPQGPGSIAAILPPPPVAPPPAPPAPVRTGPLNRAPFRRRPREEPPG
jgi:serine/threonine protein kinase